MATDVHPLVERICSLLHTHAIAYTRFDHEPVRTSEEAAAIRPEYSIAQGAKALLLRVKYTGTSSTDKSFVQIVVPGDAKFDVKKVKQVLAVNDIRFATPAEVHTLTDGVQPGGVPPFGNMFGLPVYVDRSLIENNEIIFNAGDRRVSIALKSVDYIAVVQPEVVTIV